MPSESKQPTSSKPSKRQASDPPAPPLSNPTGNAPSLIFERWDITESELTELIDENPSLRGILLGYVAEHKFRDLVEAHPKVASSRKHDDHDRNRKSDRIVAYQGEEFSIEVKSLQTKTVKQDGQVWRGKAQVDGSDKRPVRFADGSELNTTLLHRGDFDILAVNCFAFQGQWDFVYALNRDLPSSAYYKYTPEQRAQLIASLVSVSWPPEPPFVSDLFLLVEQLFRERKASGKHR